MHWEKKICVRITVRRIVGAILAASTVANLVIVGAVFGADSATAPPTLTYALLTPFWTATLFLPTSTAEQIVTSAPTLIPDATPTETSPPTETFTPTQTAVDPQIWIVCVKRFYWSTYRVQAGDTLFSIAARAGSSVNELMQANCRENDRIYSGELLYVPRLWTDPVTITPTPTGTPTSTETLAAIPTDTPTATPTDTLSPTPSITPTPTDTIVPVGCDRAQFIADVTVPPGTVMLPGTTFSKTWSVMNVGQCAWTTAYQLVFLRGEQMGAALSQPLSQTVAVGQSINISVRMTAPRSAGFYLSYWTLKNANGVPFAEPLWLEINVSDPGPTPTATQTPDFKLTVIPGVTPSVVTAP
jgi:hypothetical protein